MIFAMNKTSVQSFLSLGCDAHLYMLYFHLFRILPYSMTTFVQARTGERMVAWLGGKNMGAVTQWLYPSSNGKVLKIGASVKTVKSFEAYRMETSGTKALAIFPQKLPVGLKGKVVFLHSIGNAPTSGNALVAFDLPEAFQETDTTGGAGQTLGALLCLTTDFQHLEISD